MLSRRLSGFIFVFIFSVLSCIGQTTTVTTIDKYIDSIDNFNKNEELQQNYYSKTEYIKFRKYYNKVLKSLKINNYNQSLKIIDDYIKTNNIVFNVQDDDYSSHYNNFEVYRFVSFFTLIKGIIKLDKGEKNKGSELIYLSFFILRKYCKIETSDFRVIYYYTLYELLKIDDMSHVLKSIKEERFKGENLFLGLQYIKTTTVRLNPFLYEEDQSYQAEQKIMSELSPGGFKNNPIEQQFKVEYFKYVKSIEEALVFVNNAVDDYSREFMTKVRDEAGLNVKEEAGTENNYSYIKIMVNDDLGLRLLKKHILDL